MLKPRTKKHLKKKEKPRFSKVIIGAVLVSVAAFTVTMIALYLITGGIPDTLVTAFFAFAGGEAGCLGLIKYSDAKFTKTTDKDETPTDTSSDGEAVG